MKKYAMGGDPTASTSDELNPYKIKVPIAPNPGFVPSGATSQMKKGGQMKAKKC
jgi:hypothetical protein